MSRARVVSTFSTFTAVGAALALLAALVTEAPARSAVEDVSAASAPGHCHGIAHADVLGAKPTYSKQKLATFPNDDTVCSALWLPRPRVKLVPQSMTLGGRHTAWLVGYRWGPMGERPCRLVRIDTHTGRKVAYQSRVVGRVGVQPEQYCRHGGGIVRAQGKLWIAEKHKLWMYDPSRAGKSAEATRVWRIDMPVQGSTVVATTRSIGLVPFVKSGTPQIRWYRFAAVLKDGVTDLADQADAPKQIGPLWTTTIPTYVQGAAFGPHGTLYLTRSSARCGELLALHGRRIAFVPGAEEIQVGPKGERLWVASESGARPFQTAKHPPPLTPGILGFEWPRVLHGPDSTCHFDD